MKVEGQHDENYIHKGQKCHKFKKSHTNGSHLMQQKSQMNGDGVVRSNVITIDQLFQSITKKINQKKKKKEKEKKKAVELPIFLL
jgi:hypothetical protein